MKRIRKVGLTLGAVAVALAMTGCFAITNIPTKPDNGITYTPGTPTTPDPGNSGTTGNGGNSGYNPGGTADPGGIWEPVVITSGYEESGVYNDPNYGELDYYYQLPYVEGPLTQYIEDINKMVSNIHAEIVMPSLDAMQKGEAIGRPEVAYVVGKAGDITSLLIATYSMYSGDTTYWAWLIGPDGERATNAELFAAYGTNTAVVLDSVRTSTADFLGDFDYDEAVKMYGSDFANDIRDAREKTLSSDNINADMTFYLDEWGFLYAVVTVHTAAGAGEELYFIMV